MSRWLRNPAQVMPQSAARGNGSNQSHLSRMPHRPAKAHAGTFCQTMLWTPMPRKTT